MRPAPLSLVPRPRSQSRFPLTVLLLATLTVAIPARAQQADTLPPQPPTEPIFTVHDLVYVGGVAVATLAVKPLDSAAMVYLQRHWQTNKKIKALSRVVETTAVPGALIIGGGLYVGGRLAHDRRTADLGLHGTEAILIGTALTTVIKFTAGRARPYVSQNPHDYGLWRGFAHEEYRSFPSGHTLTAFAAAAAVTEETSEWWPHSTWYIAPLMYGGATVVGLSRMYNNKHWASDVVMGAAIGIFTGRRVVQWQHSHPGNRVDRWFLGASVGANGVVPLVAPMRVSMR